MPKTRDLAQINKGDLFVTTLRPAEDNFNKTNETPVFPRPLQPVEVLLCSTITEAGGERPGLVTGAVFDISQTDEFPADRSTANREAETAQAASTGEFISPDKQDGSKPTNSLQKPCARLVRLFQLAQKITGAECE